MDSRIGTPKKCLSALAEPPGGTSKCGVHGGVPRIRVIFSRINSEKGMSIFHKIPERTIISVRNSR